MYGIDNDIRQRMDAFRSNPQKLMQRYQQDQQLLDLLALEKLKGEKEAAKRDLAMKMGQGSATVAQKREQEVRALTQEEVARNMGMAAPNPMMQRQPQSGPPQARPPQGKPPQMGGIGGLPVQGFKHGGIVGYAEGGQVSDVVLERQVANLKQRGYSNEEIMSKLDNDARIPQFLNETFDGRSLMDRIGDAIPEAPEVPGAYVSPDALLNEFKEVGRESADAWNEAETTLGGVGNVLENLWNRGADAVSEQFEVEDVYDAARQGGDWLDRNVSEVVTGDANAITPIADAREPVTDGEIGSMIYDWMHPESGAAQVPVPAPDQAESKPTTATQSKPYEPYGPTREENAPAPIEEGVPVFDEQGISAALPEKEGVDWDRFRAFARGAAASPSRNFGSVMAGGSMGISQYDDIQAALGIEQEGLANDLAIAEADFTLKLKELGLDAAKFELDKVKTYADIANDQNRTEIDRANASLKYVESLKLITDELAATDSTLSNFMKNITGQMERLSSDYQRAQGAEKKSIAAQMAALTGQIPTAIAQAARSSTSGGTFMSLSNLLNSLNRSKWQVQKLGE